MTYKEKLRTEHPNRVNENYEGECFGCPFYYGYEYESVCRYNDDCTSCWNREIKSFKDKGGGEMTEQEVFEHIGNLVGDYKCYDERISHEESLIIYKALENQIKIKQILSDSSLYEDDCVMEIREIVNKNNKRLTNKE